jgi:hypothetical protein
LKTSNRGDGKEDVISPSGHYWISVYNLVLPVLEKLQECPLHFGKRVLTPRRRPAYESVLVAGGITACLPSGVERPEGSSAARAFFSLETFALEKVHLVYVFQHARLAKEIFELKLKVFSRTYIKTARKSFQSSSI